MTTTTLPAATITPRQRWRRRIVRLAKSVVFIYVTVALVLGALQTKLIFIGASTQGNAEAVVNPPPQSELLTLTSVEGHKVAALFGKPLRPDGTADKTNTRPTILFFYGNAMCMNDALQEFRTFRQLGNNAMLVDYLGYGMSEGNAGEQGCYDAAEAAYQYLLKRTDIDTHKIVVAGWSLGGAVAIDLARRHAGEGRIRGVMTFCTFTSMVDLAKVHYPLAPASLLLVHRFESQQKIGGLGVPMLIGHGKVDEIIPFSMSQKLAAAAEKGGVKVTRLVLDDAGHNDFFVTGEGRFEPAVAEFLKPIGGQ